MAERYPRSRILAVAVFAMWLAPRPLSDSLKQELLGRS